MFGAGAWLAVATAVMAYLTQLLYTQRWTRTADALRVITIATGLGSLCVLGWGIYLASQLFH